MSTRNVEYILSLRDKFTNTLNKANAAADKLDARAGRLTQTIQTLAPTLTLIGAIQGGKAILNLGMDMEQTNLSFEVMLGSAQKAQKMLQEIKAFSQKTPFLFPDVRENSKMLLAYGFQQEEVITQMRMLGDVAAGLKIPFGDITYLYGTLKAQGRALAIDIRQFAMRGIPIYEELAKVLKTDVKNVNALVSDGKVGFKEVEQAFKNMTGEGGRFNNLMTRLSLTAGGMASNLKDKLTFVAIAYGEKFLPQVYKAIEAGMKWAQWLEDNSEKVLKLVTVIIKIAKYFIIYKAAMLLTRGAVYALTVAHTAFRIAIIAFNRGLTTAIALTGAFNTAMKMNYIALGITAITAIILKLSQLKKKQDEVRESAAKMSMDQNKINAVLSALEKPFGNGLKNYTNVELQATADYLQDILDKTKDVGFFTKSIDRATGAKTVISNLAYKENIRRQLKILQDQLQKSGISLSPGGINDNRETTITSAAPKIININIQSLIGQQTIETNTLTESLPRIKQLITEALLDGLNDTQITSRAS